MNNTLQLITRVSLVLVFVLSPMLSFSQVLLEADGPGNTYELINSVLAPGAVAEETPDTFDPAFGRHIAEVWDAELGKYVFEFYDHVSNPNELQDISTGDTDRQRCEIKTYASSPDNLKGVSGETVQYKWRFRLPLGFQPSPNFTHIHQVKAVDGDDGNPIFTLTPRYKSSGNQLELIYVDGTTTNNITTKVASVDLSLFTGNWVEATETIKLNSAIGTYSISIINVKTGTTILSYSAGNLCTIRPTNSFVRPKWGIYRSISSLTYLRDEAVRFNSFSITELKTTDVDSYSANENEFKIIPDLNTKTFQIQYYLPVKEAVGISVYNANGQLILPLIQNQNQESGNHQFQYDATGLKNGLYLIRLNAGSNQKTIKLIR
jgi:hypothetical protein